MKRLAFTLAFTLFWGLAAVAAADDFTNQSNVPPKLRELVDKAKILDTHQLDFSGNPFYLRGDFDGDGKADYVVRVKNAAGDGDVVILRAKGAATWLERSQLNFPATDAWFVIARAEGIQQSAFEERKPPKLKGDAIWVEKLESSSAIIYWTGKKFDSYWQGD